MKPVAIVAALFLFHANSNAGNECMATLKDPHGSVDVSCDGDITATLKADEHFLAAPAPNGWNVYLKSGCRGFIDKTELQLLPNEPLMKLNFDQERKQWQKRQSDRDQLGEAGVAFKGRGLNYFKILTAASNGDEKAMALFYSVCGREMDGAAAEDCFWRGWALFHVIGDETFAKFLSGQPAKVRKRIAEILSSGDQDPISNPKSYIKRHFPKSYRILFGK